MAGRERAKGELRGRHRREAERGLGWGEGRRLRWQAGSEPRGRGRLPRRVSLGAYPERNPSS